MLWGLIHGVDLARAVLPDHHHLAVALPARSAARVAAPRPF
ncbi:hypothetical protein [Alloactinosynnema sp. L-07]|nr:hypothetical protein [Alloactinosynnema sp. L-07]